MQWLVCQRLRFDNFIHESPALHLAMAFEQKLIAKLLLQVVEIIILTNVK